MDSDLNIVLGTAVSANRERAIRGVGAEDGCSRACVDLGATICGPRTGSWPVAAEWRGIRPSGGEVSIDETVAEATS